jgi:hypothetical protein
VCDLATPASIERFFAGIDRIDHLVVTSQAANAVATIGALPALDWAAAEAAFAVKWRATAPSYSSPAPPAAASFPAMPCSIRVNVIAPGLVRSDAYAGMPTAQREAMYAARAKALPVGRIGTPEDIALAAIHLMRNGYVTGVVQDIDGGGLLG